MFYFGMNDIIMQKVTKNSYGKKKKVKCLKNKQNIGNKFNINTTRSRICNFGQNFIQLTILYHS